MMLSKFAQHNKFDEFEFGESSCELIATQLGQLLSEGTNAYSIASVEVDEDGENISRVWWAS